MVFDECCFWVMLRMSDDMPWNGRSRAFARMMGKRNSNSISRELFERMVSIVYMYAPG